MENRLDCSLLPDPACRFHHPSLRSRCTDKPAHSLAIWDVFYFQSCSVKVNCCSESNNARLLRVAITHGFIVPPPGADASGSDKL
jgi:hypothetical protein